MADHWYRGYGLCLRSEIALPEFSPATAAGEADLWIQFTTDAEKNWLASGATAADGDDFVRAPDGGFVMRVAGICDYWVHGGNQIGLSPVIGADPAAVRLYLVGSALGMVFHQRGMLVLHGATVLRRGGATIFVGDSGEGKSTLAANLGRNGHSILGDDTMPLWPRDSSGFDVWPGSRLFKLWSDTISTLGWTPDRLESVGDRLDKFFFANEAQAPDAPTPIDEIIVLEAGEPETSVMLEPLAGLEALRAIWQNTYRPEYVSLLNRDAEHFHLCTRLAAHVSVARLRRPWALGRIGETLALLRTRWAAAGRAAEGGR